MSGKKKYETMRCYVCNREMVYKSTDSGLCKSHGEHIIHNGIRGKLISHNILCEECGGEYSKDDANFCRIFAPFVVSLNDSIIHADHGKSNATTLKGILFKTPNAEVDNDGIEVTAKNGKVIPIQPFYTIKGNKIEVYAGKKRIKDYLKVLTKQLVDNGKDISKYKIEEHTDLYDHGYLAYYFSKGNDNFNEDFKKGMIKIATEYALNCGINRQELTGVLSIDGYGKAKIDYDRAILIPFIPITLFDILYEDHRDLIEEGYPSHMLKLFTSKYDNGKVGLYCYLDLFSTFQYYVLLSDDYKGKKIHETYAQRLIPNRKCPNVNHYSPKDLSIIMQEYKIENKCLEGKSYKEQIDYVQNYINKYPLHEYDFNTALKNSVEQVYKKLFAYFFKKINLLPSPKRNALIDLFIRDNIPESIHSSLTKWYKNTHTHKLNPLDVYNAFTKSIKPENYRKYGFDIIDGEIIFFSNPDESMNIIQKDMEAAKKYTYTKFSQLSYLCCKLSKSKKNLQDESDITLS
jgi:hypothetical protein